VLTAGLGTRLFPLTLTRAKPAAPVAGIPLVLRILRSLVRHGVTDAVLNLHHHPASLTGIVGDGSHLDMRVRYSWEHPVVLGSAGGPRHALPLVDERPFLLVNGDTLTDVPVTELAAAHDAGGARVTLALVPNEEPHRYGGVVLDASGSVTGFTRRGDSRPSWHFVGLQMANPDVFAGLPDGVPANSIPTLYGSLLRDEPGSVRGWCTRASFVDIGTPADYLRAHLTLAAEERVPLPSIGRRCSIARSSRITASVLWDDVIVGERVLLDRCVVGDGARIPTGKAFANAAITAAPAGVIPDGNVRIEDGLLVLQL
jgi:NDP-sugar pyrophosphorylase family protein